MPDNSVDMVFCSPPYEAARTYGIGFDLKGQDWVDWCVERYLECVRVCRGLVAWVVEGQTRKFRWSASPAMLMADLHRAGVRLRKPPIYHRVGIPGSGGPDWWRNDYEFVICSSKGKLPWSDNTATGHPPKWAPGGEMSYRLTDGTRRNQWGGSANGISRRLKDGIIRLERRPGLRVIGKKHTKRDAGGMREPTYEPTTLANPGNVLKVRVGGGLMGHKLAHENEAAFPESLVVPFIVSFCPLGGLVLDPFCGSGTTLAVAKRFGRDGIGIDVRESQVELAKRRLETTQPEMLT
jgi:hypothetical protein